MKAAKAASVRTGRPPVAALLAEADGERSSEWPRNAGYAAWSSERAQDANRVGTEWVPQQGAGQTETVVGVAVAENAFPLAEFPILQLVYNPDIRDFMVRFLRAVSARVWACLFTFDDEVIVDALIALLRREAPWCVEVRLLLDKKQMCHGSCSRQLERVNLVMQWGAVVRLRDPAPALFAMQHEKAWLGDGNYVCGSANCTGNSYLHCEEQVLFTSAQQVVEKAEAHFLKIWESGEPYTAEQHRKWTAAREARRRSKSREPRTRSRMASVPERSPAANTEGGASASAPCSPGPERSLHLRASPPLSSADRARALAYWRSRSTRENPGAERADEQP